MVLDQQVTGRHVVVLGGGGFIGSNLCNRLLALGAHVTAVDTVFPSWRRPDVMCRRADLTSLAETARAIVGAELVFHLAADMGGVGYFHSNADLGASLVNGQITLNVAQAVEAHETPTTFYASSACAYPVELQQTPGEAPALSEDLIGHGTPDALYGAEKLHGLRIMGKVPGARVGVLHTVFGPLQEHEGRRMKFPAAVATKALAARETGRLEVWGDGRQLRSYLFVDDAVDRLVTLAEADENPGPIMVGAEGSVSCDEIARLCLDLAGVPDAEVVHVDGPTGVAARDCDLSRWRAVFGEPSQRSYREGFAEFMAWLDGIGAEAVA